MPKRERFFRFYHTRTSMHICFSVYFFILKFLELYLGGNESQIVKYKDTVCQWSRFAIMSYVIAVEIYENI